MGKRLTADKMLNEKGRAAAIFLARLAQRNNERRRIFAEAFASIWTGLFALTFETKGPARVPKAESLEGLSLLSSHGLVRLGRLAGAAERKEPGAADLLSGLIEELNALSEVYRRSKGGPAAAPDRRTRKTRRRAGK